MTGPRSAFIASFARRLSSKFAKLAKVTHAKRATFGLLMLGIAACALAQIKIACVGDSELIGAYPAELQRILGSKFEVREFGRPGATVSPVGNHEFDGSTECAAAMAYAPDIVVVLIGSNGPMAQAGAGVEGFEPNYRHLLKRFHDLAGHPKVYMWTFPDAEVNPNMRAMAEYFNSYIHPLSLQAAREAGAIAIEEDIFGIEPFAAGSAGAREAAQFVAEILAPATIKAHWKIVRASSFQADEGPAQNAIDGDPDTFWHSEYDPKLAKPPHTRLCSDPGESHWLTGFKYLPRQDGGTNGNVKDYEIYVGDSPDSQTTLAAKGTFRNGRNQKTARFRVSVKCRYVRFVCLSEENGQSFASAAEVDIIRDPSKN